MNNSLIIADKGARIGNFIIDTFFILMLFVVCSILIQLLLNSFDLSADGIPDIVFLVLYFSYYLSFELILGKTPGKYITKTKTVALRGEKLNLRALIFRTLCRLVPIDIFSFVFGTGLHDNLSGTAVISYKKQGFSNEPH